jgi:hypothetical protein
MTPILLWGDTIGDNGNRRSDIRGGYNFLPNVSILNRTCWSQRASRRCRRRERLRDCDFLQLQTLILASPGLQDGGGFWGRR